MKKWLVLPLLTLAVLLIAACQDENAEKAKEQKAPTEDKSLEMYQASELAQLMRKMYEDNLDIRQEILKGKLPKSFPEDFKTIHTAQATDPEEINETFHALADQYLKNIEAIEKAENPAAAKIAYNNMIATCASCHQIYCQGPLAKIRKMRITDLPLGNGA